MNYEEIEIFATRALINFCFSFRFSHFGLLDGGEWGRGGWDDVGLL